MQRADHPAAVGAVAADASTAGITVTEDDAASRAFSTSIVVSGIRCMLAYVVFPWILPAAGIAGGVGPGIGLGVGVVAIGFNIASIRRFHVSDHRWKWQVTTLNSMVIALLTALLVMDLRQLL